MTNININDSLPPESAEVEVDASVNDAVSGATANRESRNAGATDRTDDDATLPKGEKNNAFKVRDESEATTVPSSTGEVQAQDATTDNVLKSDTAADGVGSSGGIATSTATTEEQTNPSASEEVPVCRLYADDDNSQPGDLEEQEEEVEENIAPENRAASAVNAGDSSRLGPGALGDTVATGRSETTGHIDIQSQLARLGIPMVEAELVTTPEESQMPTAESRHSPTLANTTAGMEATSTEEADDVYQAEHIPTVNLCGKEMTRSTAILSAGIAALFVAIAVGVPVSVYRNQDGAIAPRGKIDLEEAARRSRVTDAITAFAKGNISDPDLPHGQALEWMLGPENAHLDFSIPRTNQGLMTKQRFAMALFYYTTGGDSWLAKDEFLSEEHICDWSTMIVCANEKNNQEVKELQFGNNNLQGTLPQEFLYLDTLKTLNLTGNLGLSGSLPPEIGEISSLEILDLRDAKFVGTIPDSFVNLRNLQHLDLRNNFLQEESEYRVVGSSVIGSLRELRHLDLSGNLFNQLEPAALFRLSRLEYLDISNNEFNLGDQGYKFDAMPSTIGALANLKVFNVANNNLGGTINPNIGKCKRLEELSLSGNGYTEGIPSELGQLKALRVLDLSNNVGLGGSIPSALENCKNLKHLNLKNSGITGSIPKEFGRGMNMDTLILDVNFLTGSIPKDIFNMQNLSELRLASNSLEGSIPAEVGNATGLLDLTFFENNLEGPLPSEIGNLVNLSSLVFGWNGLNSRLPETLGNLVNLEVLLFDDNFFTGQLPTTLGNLKNLREIHLTNNAFNGTLPSELGRLTALEDVGLNDNEFTGTIPRELGNLGNIWFLGIGQNPFSGTVPGWIGTSKLAQRLTHFEVSATNLEGTLPAEWGMLSSLKILKMQRNPLITGTIPLEWANMTNLGGMWMFNTSLTGSVSHLCREDFVEFGSQECEDCGLEVDLEDVQCDCCKCCIDNDYVEPDDDAYGDDDGKEEEVLDEDDLTMGST